MSDSKFARVYFEWIQEYGLSVLECAFLDRVDYYSNLSDTEEKWCYVGKDKLAKEFNVTKQTILNCVKGLVEDNLLIKNNKGWIKVNLGGLKIRQSKNHTSQKNRPVKKVYSKGSKNLISGGLKTLPNKNNIKEILEESKYHSSDFSETKIEGTPNEDFSIAIEETIEQPETLQEEPRKEPKPASHPFKMTDEDIEYLMPYHNGLIEEINKLAKVKYSKKINSICKAFHCLDKNKIMLRCIYTYFRTYRNTKDEYAVVVHSLESFANKIEKLMNEAEKQTRELETKKQSSVYHIDHERRVVVFNSWSNVPQKDLEILENLVHEKKYMPIPMKPLVGQYKPYNRQPEIPKRNTFA
jgi:DNA-binding MarR family transcriptional regulator